VTSADLSIVLSSYGSITSSTYRSEADFNRDGDVDAADLAAVLSYAAALPEGTLSSPGIANRTGYCGYRFAPETEMYLARNRWLSPPLGRWIERDPLGYVDGGSLYQYVACQPTVGSDPSGELRHVFAFEGLFGHNDDLLTVSDPFVAKYWEPVVKAITDTVWHYYAQTDGGIAAAVAEASKIAKTPDPSAPAGTCYHTIIVLGYSNGGRAAVQFAEKLRDQNIAVNLGFTADPAPKGLELLPPLILFPSAFLTKPANVGHWRNHYQRTDQAIKGNKIEGADFELEYTDLGESGHVRIPRDKRVTADITGSVSGVAIWRATWKWRP